MDPLAAAREALAKGKRAALVTVVGLEGEPPSREGMAFALIEGGATHGTLGCDGFDRSAAADAARALETGTRFERVYDWDEDSRIHVDVRLLAAGDAVEASAQPELLVVGEAPVARALIALGGTLGFRIRTATKLSELSAGPDTYVVICGHDEEFSQPALRVLLPSRSPYLGMMGSRRHTGHLVEELRASGASEVLLRRVHTPVGLDLRAQTPEEIALAALAHIVAVRRGGTGAPIA